MTIRTASTIHTLQGVTAHPGLIFHWKFPRFYTPELRWLATYVALSRPPSLAQLISIGIPAELRDIIESGPPEGILTRFNDMFQDLEVATHMYEQRKSCKNWVGKMPREFCQLVVGHHHHSLI